MHAMQQQLEGMEKQGLYRPKVVFCKGGEHYDIYAGRGNCPRTEEPGEWGNPYSHRPSRLPDVVMVATVEDAVALHKRELWERISAGELPLERLAALADKVWGCWCHKPPCHAYTLAAAASWAAAELVRRA